jgi:hypothetical protein
MATHGDEKAFTTDTLGTSVDIKGGEVSKLSTAFDSSHDKAGIALVEQGELYWDCDDALPFLTAIHRPHHPHHRRAESHDKVGVLDLLSVQ